MDNPFSPIFKYYLDLLEKREKLNIPIIIKETGFEKFKEEIKEAQEK